VAVKDRIK